MSRGYPDFFGTQTFPYYGPTYGTNISEDIAAGAWALIKTLEQKAVIRGGYWYCYSTATLLNVNFYVVIDGTIVDYCYPFRYLTYHGKRPDSSPLTVDYYDLVDTKRLGGGFYPGYTFGQTWSLYGYHDGAADLKFRGIVSWNKYA